MKSPLSLDLSSLSTAYRSGSLKPADLINLVYERIAARGSDAVWIHLRPMPHVLQEALELQERLERGESLPLYGVPFAVKDNIDAADLPTTAACPEFSYRAKISSPLVDRLQAAGALLLGKTNLDQFATGLVGTRSPYGAPSCVFNSDYISGGSSSGSAVAVAAGLVSFALGTDTAGSGRVPAAFNNIVGWKPSRGLLSTQGVVPACRSLDCVSVLSLTCDDAAKVGQVVRGFDAHDPYSRVDGKQIPPWPLPFRFGVPSPSQLKFFGDDAASKLFWDAVATLESCGGRKVEIDFEPFAATAALLYEGPWVAERFAAIGPFLEAHPQSMLPVTHSIIRGASKWQGADVFKGFYRLEELRRQTMPTWEKIDVMVLPTAGTHYTKAMVAEDPITLNTNLGYYTNFANLLDLAVLAVPAGFRDDGLPFGISFSAPALSDDALCHLGSLFHATIGGTLGASGHPVKAREPRFEIAVVGAHLSGEPLNHQLTSRGGYLVASTRTKSDYKLYNLVGTHPPKPGLVRVPGFVGPGIEVEVWSLGAAAFANFVNEVPQPLAIGNAMLVSGHSVKCFVCEPAALLGSQEITHFGGWKAYRNSPAP